MKYLFLLTLFCLSFAAPASADVSQLQLCTVKYAKVVIPIAEKHSSFDKNRHCTVSCMLSLLCSDAEVLLAGAAKEFLDLLGAGQAERADMAANKYGVDLVRFDRALLVPECLNQCDLRY
jgi:hypothetical protein